MDLATLEYAVSVIFALVRKHPEICPHDYHWAMAHKLPGSGNDWEHDYECKLCGRIKKITTNSDRAPTFLFEDE